MLKVHSGPGLPLASVFTVSGVSPHPVGSEEWWEAVWVWTPTLPACGPDSSSHGVLQRRFPSQSAFLLPLCLFCSYSPSKFCPNEWTSKEMRRATTSLQKEEKKTVHLGSSGPLEKGLPRCHHPHWPLTPSFLRDSHSCPFPKDVSKGQKGNMKLLTVIEREGAKSQDSNPPISCPILCHL